MNVNVAFTYNPNGAIAKLLKNLDGQGRISLNAAMGVEVQHTTARHLAALERAPDSLLSKLGAAPTNFYKHAAERTESPAALATDANAATLTLNFPGVGRAFHPITITPVTAKALAIPMDRLAVGRSPRDCWKELGLFIPKGKGFIAMRDGNQIKVMWLLRRKVTQPQNRGILPSDEQWQAAANLGAKTFLRTALN